MPWAQSQRSAGAAGHPSPRPGRGRARTEGDRLRGCHVDPHKGRFAAGGARAKGKGCLACHDVRTFRPSTADVAAHAKFSFVLEAAHRATACVGCHEEMKRAGVTRRSSLLLAASRIAELRFEAEARVRGLPRDTARASIRRAERPRPVRRLPWGGRLRPSLEVRPHTGRHVLDPGRAQPCAVQQCHPKDQEKPDAEGADLPTGLRKCESCHGNESKKESQ